MVNIDIYMIVNVGLKEEFRLLFSPFTVSSVGFAFVLPLSVFGFFKFMAWVIAVDCVGVGICIASTLWYLHFKRSMVS